MDQNLDTELEKEKPDLKKFRQAGCGFLGLTIVYFALTIIFPPPPFIRTVFFSPVGIFTGIALCVVFTVFIYKGKRFLVQVLAVIYGLRAGGMVVSLVMGNDFPAVPYILSCHVATCYLLGRAAWDWP